MRKKVTANVEASPLDQVRKATVANIMRKIRAGRVPTQRDEELLRQHFAAGDAAPDPEAEPNLPSSFGSMKQAAAALNLPLSVLQAAKRAGCTAFRSSRVYRSELIDWLDANRDKVRPPPGEGGELLTLDDRKSAKLDEEIRKLRIKNDRDEGRQISRAFVAQCIQRMGGEVSTLRARSEAEHALRFATAKGDPAKCRRVLREIWDDIMQDLNRLGKHFEESDKTESRAA